MKDRKGTGFQSALLVNKWIIAGFFVLSVVAWRLGAEAVAVLLLALAVVGAVSLFWGMTALNDLGADVSTKSRGLSVGESVEFSYEIVNDKRLPLIWLEICQDVPKNNCLVPDENLTLRVFSEAEAEYSGRKNAYMRRFSFLMGHRTLSFSCVWTGNARGVYRPDDIILRSGDGFGLTQSVGKVKGLKGRTFAVWPKIVPVDSSVLIRNVWSGTAGRMGYAEDITVLRDEKEYMEGDSWKRIDWRTAARTDELYTKYYDRIRPQSVLFAVDTASIRDKEEALSIAASLIKDLSGKGIAAGLALPATEEKEAVLIKPGDASCSCEELLFELADHDVMSASAVDFNFRGILFAAQETGQIWIIGEDVRSVRSGRLYIALKSVSPRILCAKEDGSVYTFGRIKL